VASANLLSEPTIFLGKCLYQVRNVTVVFLVVPFFEMVELFVTFCFECALEYGTIVITFIR
jgi:hypothetical protein